ncbi:hypothetical protein Ddye_007512 [Dipteronia dyeriana]|uniref:SWI/SNF complex subunit SWI3B n=1 Tax=Dipteronia dyeriana TaxID=168575 RepID=A0AAD9XK84_9ROSI|nr:hypothetical protein Ddye_007512 [Dipteronia dyeriana]
MAAKSPLKDTPPPAAKQEPLSSSDVEADVVNVPSYSRWFSWDTINECEVRFLPEFFDSRSPSKNPGAYKYYRDSIIRHYRDNPSRKITFTDVRRILVGDVGSIRRVFDFLDTWGLVNYSASAKPLKWEDKETKSAGGGGSASESSSITNKENSKTLCSGCKSVCSIACFYCDKYDLTLCARCYVRGNHRVGVNSSDFRRVEISEETRTDWTDKDTLQLLEAIMHYGDDWRKVAQHVGGRSEKDCITHFIKLRFGEELIDHPDLGEVDNNVDGGLESIVPTSPSKRMRLSPLADASNPIMAQAAFLSALAGIETAEAAARAAVKTLSEVDNRASKVRLGPFPRNTKHEEAEVASNGDTSRNTLESFTVEANSSVEKDERDLEKAISGIIEVQMREIQNKIVRFEKLDLQMEKERQQLEQMKNMLFVDQLSLLFHKTPAPKTGEHMEENKIVKPNVS